jgi:hypothetical protein
VIRYCSTSGHCSQLPPCYSNHLPSGRFVGIALSGHSSEQCQPRGLNSSGEAQPQPVSESGKLMASESPRWAVKSLAIVRTWAR